MGERHINPFVFDPANDELFREGRHTGPWGTGDDEPQLISVQHLIARCSDLCREIASMLAVAGISGDSTIERKRGLVRRESMQVVEQRLLLWGATISDYKDHSSLILLRDHIRILNRIRCVLCGMRIMGRVPYNYPVRFREDLLPLVGSLYSNLPGTLRETIEWALTATLMKTTAPTMINEKIQLNDSDPIFLKSLGSSEIEQNFGSMLDLIDESKVTSPVPLLTPDNLISSGSYDGIGVYSEKSDMDGPPMGGLISIRTEWTMEQATTDLGDMVYVRTKYQQRLRLPKPDEMRVLVLGGYFENLATGRVELLYRIPHWASQKSPPVSLRRLLAEKQLPKDIGVRFSIARKLICAILFFHACKWVHGNIDDQNIIFFEDSERNLNFEEPFFCRFIPSSKDTGEAVPTTKESADAIFGNDVKLRNADTGSLWRTVLLVIFERETVASNGSPHDSRLGYVGANNDVSKWVEIDELMQSEYGSDWSGGGGMGRSTLEGNLGGNDDHIIRQGNMFWKFTRILNICSSRSTTYSRDRIIQRSYTGTWSAIPSLGLEGYERTRSLGKAESREGIDTQSTSTDRSLRMDIDLPRGSEKQETQDEVFPVTATHEQIMQWRKDVLPRLERILEKHLPAEESVSIDLLGIGTCREQSRPTIVVTCKSSRLVKRLLKKFVYDRAVFSLKVRKGSVQRSSGGGREDRDSKRQERPLPGASIGACRDGIHLPAATYGGLVLVDEKPYGLTVHHLVDTDDHPTEEQDAWRVRTLVETYASCHSATDENTYVEEGQLIGGPRHVDIGNVPLYPESEGGGSGSEGGSGSDVEYDQESLSESLVCEVDYQNDGRDNTIEGDDFIGDKPGLERNHVQRIVVVQPAEMDLLEEEKSGSESVTEEYHLGTFLASSGIRRIIFESEKHEIDWALIEISADRLGQRNLIQGGGRFLTSSLDKQDSEPCSYVPMVNFGGLAVHGIGRTSGLQRGEISQAISSIRMSGRKTFSRSWNVTGEIGDHGDSGAWVVDNRCGGVCGHIIAGHSVKNKVVAYINPMELLLQDIKETLQADSVCLPTNAAAAQVGDMDESTWPRGGGFWYSDTQIRWFVY